MNNFPPAEQLQKATIATTTESETGVSSYGRDEATQNGAGGGFGGEFPERDSAGEVFSSSMSPLVIQRTEELDEICEASKTLTLIRNLDLSAPAIAAGGLMKNFKIFFCFPVTQALAGIMQLYKYRRQQTNLDTLQPGTYLVIRTDGYVPCLVLFHETCPMGGDAKDPNTLLRVEWFKPKQEGNVDEWISWLDGDSGERSLTLEARCTVALVNIGIRASSVTSGPIASQCIKLDARTCELLGELT